MLPRRQAGGAGVARTCRRGCLPRALVPPGVLTPPNSWSQPTVHRIVPHRLAWCILVLTTYTLPGVGCNALGASMVLTTSTHARRHTRSRTWRHPPLRRTSLSFSSAVRLCTFKRESDRHACPSSTRAATNKFHLMNMTGFIGWQRRDVHPRRTLSVSRLTLACGSHTQHSACHTRDVHSACLVSRSRVTHTRSVSQRHARETSHGAVGV